MWVVVVFLLLQLFRCPRIIMLCACFGVTCSKVVNTEPLQSVLKSHHHHLWPWVIMCRKVRQVVAIEIIHSVKIKLTSFSRGQTCLLDWGCWWPGLEY